MQTWTVLLSSCPYPGFICGVFSPEKPCGVSWSVMVVFNHTKVSHPATSPQLLRFQTSRPPVQEHMTNGRIPSDYAYRCSIRNKIHVAVAQLSYMNWPLLGVLAAGHGHGCCSWKRTIGERASARARALSEDSQRISLLQVSLSWISGRGSDHSGRTCTSTHDHKHDEGYGGGIDCMRPWFVLNRVSNQKTLELCTTNPSQWFQLGPPLVR